MAYLTIRIGSKHRVVRTLRKFPFTSNMDLVLCHNLQVCVNNEIINSLHYTYYGDS